MHRSTVRLDQDLLVQAKEYAARQRRTLTAVIEDALRAQLNVSSKSRLEKRRRAALPVSRCKPGFRSGPKTWEEVKRLLEDGEIENFQRVARDAASRR